MRAGAPIRPTATMWMSVSSPAITMGARTSAWGWIATWRCEVMRSACPRAKASMRWTRDMRSLMGQRLLPPSVRFAQVLGEFLFLRTVIGGNSIANQRVAAPQVSGRGEYLACLQVDHARITGVQRAHLAIIEQRTVVATIGHIIDGQGIDHGAVR